MILSDKSCGSTALLKGLIRAGGRTTPWTRHNEHETLFWCKAAAVLGLPQVNMEYSELPLDRDRALVDLQTFCDKNLGPDSVPIGDLEGICEAWRRISHRYSYFVEKSPHHLQYDSALDLIAKHADAKLIGLVRDPRASLYSSWKRWSADPNVAQQAWVRAYSNLLKLHSSMLVVRYEDLAEGHGHDQVLGWAELPGSDLGFHSQSLERWRSDPEFRFSPSKDLLFIAKAFGYWIEEDACESRQQVTGFPWMKSV